MPTSSDQSSALSSPVSCDHSTCFALLDDARSQEPQSRLYSGFIRNVPCHDEVSWHLAWHEVQLALSAQYYVVAVLSYETGAQLQHIQARSHPENKEQISQFLVFAKCQLLSPVQVSQWLITQSTNACTGIRALHANINPEEFTEAIDAIRGYIAAGDTYQVNFTYRLRFEVLGNAVALYLALRERQPVPYGALICLPNRETVLSLSPELFIRHQQGTLFARPMKGTAAATGDDVIDHTIGEQLRNDGKNRAENLMIVDLLRNDLGRIAQTGSVRVPQLFEVNRFSSVLQMTSSIEADLRPDLSLDAIMSALFPCGSITGAPKRRTMEIIREIESEARGIYTGAIGWFDPPGEAANIGDFCLSVPIRTLHLSRPDQQGVRQGMMGVGAGIVYDSQAQDEFEECQLKAKFLTGLQANFELFETMHATKEDGCRHWLRHFDRLRASASYFEFPFDATILEHNIRAVCASFLPNTSYRLRLALRSDGKISLQHAPLAPLPNVVNLLISQQQCDTPALFLAHKSSNRQQYDHAWQEAEKRGAFDQLFINSAGMVTEGGRSNVFIRCGEQWFTPPLSDGVLPGIMRAVLLTDTSMNASEKSCTLHELENADQIIVCNALRGILQAQLVS